MKVCYFTLGGRGGSDKALIDILVPLRRYYGINPFVICDRRDLIPYLEAQNIDYLNFKFKWAIYPVHDKLVDKILFIPRIIHDFYVRHKNVNDLCRIVANDIKPDIIHTNVGVINIGYKISRKLSIPHIWHLREYQSLDHNMHYVGGHKTLKKCLKKNQFNIGITKQLFQYFELSFPSVQIYDGVREERHWNGVFPHYSPVFLFVGFLYEGKGIDEVLSAYNDYVRQGGVNKLYIAGALSETNGFHKKIKQYVIDNKLDGVKFLGFRDDIDKIMESCAAVIVASRFEAFGRVTAEAMFNKTLVIGKDTAGTKEQFDNVDAMAGAEVSLRYQGGKELTQCLFKVDNMSIEERKQLIKAGFDTVNELYTNEKSAAQVYEYYKRVIDYGRNRNS